MLIRREVITTIGFFDERYTSYCEETDFCYRIRHDTRWRLYYVPAAEIVHFGGQSFSKVPEYRLRLMYSGYNKFLTKTSRAHLCAGNPAAVCAPVCAPMGRGPDQVHVFTR